MSNPSPSSRPDSSSTGSRKVQAAPYPPFLTASESAATRQAHHLRSSLSSSPHYSKNVVQSERVSNKNSSLYSSPHSAAATSSSERETKDQRGRSASLGEQHHQERGNSPRSAATSRRLVAPVRVQYSPVHSNIYACINSSSSTEQQQPPSPSSSSTTQRKVGPVLCELRQLNLVTDIEARRRDHQLFQSTTLAVSRGNPQLGLSVTSTCLSMQPNSSAGGETLKCATGLTTGALGIHSFRLDDNEWNHHHASLEYFAPARHSRLASSVAWRPSPTNHVAIGHVGGPSSGMRRGVVGSRAGGGDRDFCCLVWDVETQGRTTGKGTGQTPVTKLSHNAGVASLAWLQDGQTLAVGCQQRTVQIYDLRVSGTNSPPISTFAHDEGVNGIHVDPHRPNVFATYSRSVGEPVKLWDARRMDSCLGEIKTSGLFASLQQTNDSAVPETELTPATSSGSGYMSLFGTTGLDGPVVSTIRWSFLNPGTICVAIGDTIRHYDTTSSGSRPVLTHINHAPGPIMDMATHQQVKTTTTTAPTQTSGAAAKSPETKDQTKQQQKQQDAVNKQNDLQSHRMLVALSDGTIHDMPKFRIAPLAISRRDGRVVHALGRTVWIGSTDQGPSAMENLRYRHDEDISATMMRRARCLRTTRYSMDAAANIQMLSEEKNSGGDATPVSQQNSEELLRLWSWIERVESLCSYEAVTHDEDNPWTAKGLIDSGVWKLLGMDGANQTGAEREEATYSDSLFCNTYDSAPRRAALTACGWAGKYKIGDVLADCEALGEFERSAALAVWHGDIGAAVEALQRGSDFLRSPEEDTDEVAQSSESLRYAETLQLVSMCIAGYSCMDPSSSSSSVWRRACTNLLAREELNGDHRKLSGVSYLRGLCTFLISVGAEDGLDKVLHDEYLSLCDRVAFACRFLERRDLKSYLAGVIDMSQKTGKLEGCTVTGLERNGVAILQSYVDKSADVQTAALVCSRVVMPADWASERSTCSEFVECYRDLLNTWQMWQSRAMFDVDRAGLLRHIKERQAEDAQAPGLRGSLYQNRGRGSQGAKKLPYPSPTPKQAAVAGSNLPLVPAQLEARCNYCSMPLSGLRREAGISNQWLNKLKPVLQCCPRCRKPLPRCSICLLSLGCLNPYTELKRAGNRQVRPGVGLQAGDDMTRLANLPFAEWFTWCMRCKHGGHAHHLVGWFANHDVCPVSGCNCQCQFDGIQKLNRPALASPSKHDV